MKKNQILIISVAAVVAIWGGSKLFKSKDLKENTQVTKAEAAAYWTCPMHPQIHLDHAGECPICHMKLVQVKAQEVEATQNQRSAVVVSQAQLDFIGVQKEQVERMDLVVSIPIAGRLISSTSVAFQVYESDLKYIKPGLLFQGTSSLSDENDLSGRIASVDSIVDPTSRTIRVVGSLTQMPKGLISETTFSGLVKVDLKGRISIPESAVLHTGTANLVYVFTEDGRVVAQSVKLGAKSEGFFEVLSGLEAGQYISSGPNFLIDSEAKIRGTSEPTAQGESKVPSPSCPEGEHWDIPMAMCMPGKARK